MREKRANILFKKKQEEIAEKFKKSPNNQKNSLKIMYRLCGADLSFDFYSPLRWIDR